MSIVLSQLHQDIQNELTMANQLLYLISLEVKEIKELTRHGSRLDKTVKENASLLDTLTKIQNIDTENLATVRMDLDINENNGNLTYEEHESFRVDTDIDETM